jgi:hypothetical protein
MQFFEEFTETKDVISLKQYQQFFLECVVLIIVDDVNVKVISITCIHLFSIVMDGLGSSFSPQISLCMLMASNKSSHNTVMRERVLDIVLVNDVSLEFAISTLNIWLFFGKFSHPPSSSNFLEQVLMIVNNCHER